VVVSGAGSGMQVGRPPNQPEIFMAAPYQSAKIWAVDVLGKPLKFLPPDVRFKG